jgi:transcriptional regulator with XRE-family HTH domain
MTTLAGFLRARREQLQPSDVGLPDSGRRRTPGLRREEVATLAGVSIDYLVRLEQGRDTHPSGSVIAALADALRLDEDERRQLSELALRGHAVELCPEARPLARDVAPTVRALVDRLDPTPAFVVGPSHDVLAWNPTWERLVGALGLLDGGAPGVPGVPNLAGHVFLHPGARTVYPDWDAVADEQVSRLRDASTRWGHDDGFITLMDELRTSPHFTARWSVFGPVERRRGTRLIAHAELGGLRFDYEVLLLPGDDEQRLVTWLPADDITARATAEAVPSSPAQLRVIR